MGWQGCNKSRHIFVYWMRTRALVWAQTVERKGRGAAVNQAGAAEACAGTCAGRMMKRAVAALAFVAVFLLLVLAPPAYGLTCAEPPQASEEFAASEAVFRGVVADKRRTEAGTVVTFQVREVWKGPVVRETELLESDMWLTFEKGKQYLVYVDADRDSRRAKLCGNTKLWERGAADAATFGAPSIAAFPEQWAALPGWVAVAVVIGAVAFIAAYFAIRRWRRHLPTRRN